jgi:hypothetical protein
MSRRHFGMLGLGLSALGRGGRATQTGQTDQSRRYSAAQLKAGINLAEDFPVNPFLPAFRKVDEAMLAKQTNEKDLAWKVFEVAPNGVAAQDLIARSEADRASLVKAIKSAFAPVAHTIRVEAS